MTMLAWLALAAWLPAASSAAEAPPQDLKSEKAATAVPDWRYETGG
jgi:hypothetical protein